MSRNSYKTYDDHHPYYITSSLKFGLPVFSVPLAAKVILDNIVYMRKNKGLRVTAFVIMENHFHAIIQGENLAIKIARFKSYSARKIIDLFKEQHRTRWLKRLKAVKQEYKTDREYQLWQEGFHPKQIIGDHMMAQKIEYIHQNPVKRGYVDKAEHWRYSSARNYAGIEGLIPIDVLGVSEAQGGTRSVKPIQPRSD